MKNYNEDNVIERPDELMGIFNDKYKDEDEYYKDITTPEIELNPTDYDFDPQGISLYENKNKQYMKANKIKLNESQLRKLIRESIEEMWNGGGTDSDFGYRYQQGPYSMSHSTSMPMHSVNSDNYGTVNNDPKKAHAEMWRQYAGNGQGLDIQKGRKLAMQISNAIVRIKQKRPDLAQNGIFDNFYKILGKLNNELYALQQNAQSQQYHMVSEGWFGDKFNSLKNSFSGVKNQVKQGVNNIRDRYTNMNSDKDRTNDAYINNGNFTQTWQIVGAIKQIYPYIKYYFNGGKKNSWALQCAQSVAQTLSGNVGNTSLLERKINRIIKKVLNEQINK